MTFAAIAAALLVSTAPPQSTGQAEGDVAAVLDSLHRIAASGDGKAYFDLYTPEARFVGTDATEHWTIPQFQEFARQYFDRGRGWTYEPRERSITIAPIDCRCIAWFDETLYNTSYGETRGSGVLRLTDAGWKIEQYVLSVAVPNDKAREVVAVIRGGQ